MEGIPKAGKISANLTKLLFFVIIIMEKYMFLSCRTPLKEAMDGLPHSSQQKEGIRSLVRLS